MSTLIVETTSTETLADLLHRLGDISPNRIRMHPPLGTATEADVVRIQAQEKRLFELVDGVLVEKGMGYRESYLAGVILEALRLWVMPRKLGLVTGEAGMMSLFANQIRIPDVAFAAWERFPGKRFPSEPVPNIAPDLAVEVLSESNTKREMTRKCGEYFDAGTRLVWIVDPKNSIVTAYTGPETFQILNQEQTLDGGAVLPGFTLSLRTLFAIPTA